MSSNILTKNHLTEGVLRQYIRFLLERRRLNEDDNAGPDATRDVGDPGLYGSQKADELESRTETFKTEMGDVPFFFTKIADFGEMTRVASPGAEPGEAYSVVMTSDEPYTLVVSADPRYEESSKLDEDLGTWTITNKRFMWFDKTLNLLSPFFGKRNEIFKNKLPRLYSSLVDKNGKPDRSQGSDRIWLIKNSELETFSQVEETSEIIDMINQDINYPIDKSFSFVHEGPANVIIGDLYEGDLYFGFLTENTPASSVIATYESEVHVVASTISNASLLRTDKIGDECAMAIRNGTYTPKLGDNTITLDRILASNPNVTWVVVNASALKKVGGVKEQEASILQKIVMPYRESPGWLKSKASTVFDTVELVCSVVGIFIPPVLILSAAASICNLMLAGGEFSKGYMTTGGFVIQIVFAALSVLPLFNVAREGVSLSKILSSLESYGDDAFMIFHELLNNSSAKEVILKIANAFPVFKTGLYSLFRESMPAVNEFLAKRNISAFKNAFFEVGSMTNLANDVARFRSIVERTMVLSKLGNDRATQMWDNLWRTCLPDPPALIDIENLLAAGDYKQINDILNSKKSPNTPAYKFSYVTPDDVVISAAAKVNGELMLKFGNDRMKKIESIKKDIDTLDPISSFFTKRCLNDLIDASKNLDASYALPDSLKAKITIPDEAKMSASTWEWISFTMMSWILVPALGSQMLIDKAIESN